MVDFLELRFKTTNYGLRKVNLVNYGLKLFLFRFDIASCDLVLVSQCGIKDRPFPNYPDIVTGSKNTAAAACESLQVAFSTFSTCRCHRTSRFTRLRRCFASRRSLPTSAHWAPGLGLYMSSRRSGRHLSGDDYRRHSPVDAGRKSQEVTVSRHGWQLSAWTGQV